MNGPIVIDFHNEAQDSGDPWCTFQAVVVIFKKSRKGFKLNYVHMNANIILTRDV